MGRQQIKHTKVNSSLSEGENLSSFWRDYVMSVPSGVVVTSLYSRCLQRDISQFSIFLQWISSRKNSRKSLLHRNKSLSATSTTKHETQLQIDISDTPENESTDSTEATYTIPETSLQGIRDVQHIDKKRLRKARTIILEKK